MKHRTFLTNAEARADYWAVYDAHYDAIQEQTDVASAAHPVFGPILAAMPDKAIEAQHAQARRDMAKVCGDGDWAPFAAKLQGEGVNYARLHVDLYDWHDHVRLMTNFVVPFLVQAYGAEPPRLTAVLHAMIDYMDLSMISIATGYMDEKQRRLDEQRQLAEQHAVALATSEAELRQQARLLDSILNSLADSVSVLAPDGRTILFNSQSHKLQPQLNLDNLTQPTRVEVCNVDGTPMPSDRRPSVRALRGEAVDNHTVLLSGYAGVADVYLEMNARPVRDDDGQVVAAVITSRDVTEKRRLQAISDRAAELEQVAERNQEASRLKSEFLASMSHELRTPLNIIIGFSEMLHRHEVNQDEPEYDEFLRDILAGAKQLLQLINDVLDLAKVEAGKLEFHHEVIDVEALLQQVVHILRGKAAEKNIKLIAEAGDNLGEVVADQHRVLQILYNYVANALKFTPEGGRVTLRAIAQGDQALRIEVQDSGMGIKAEELNRLFIEFQQLSGGADKSHEGTGLGLALCRKLAEAQGASVGVRSTWGEGSTFHVVLPREQMAATLQRDMRTSAGNANERWVLVVEDNRADQDLIVRTLTEAGYATQTAATASQALLAAKERDYAAIVLDLLLPDGTGMDLLKLLRASGRNATTPVLIVSVVPDSHSVRAHKVDAWLAKPIEPEALIATLQRVLGQRSAGATVLVIDDEPAALRLMEATLRQMGCAAICHTDVQLALAAARCSPLDAIVLDLLMPEISGFEVLEMLRADEQLRDVPVLIWTSKELTAADRERLRRGATSTIAKGDGSEIARALEQAIAQRRRHGD